MEEKEKKLLPIVESRLIGIEDMTKLDNLPLVGIIVTMDSCKDHQWMLEQMGENVLRNRMFVCSQSLFSQNSY